MSIKLRMDIKKKKSLASRKSPSVLALSIFPALTFLLSYFPFPPDYVFYLIIPSLPQI